MSSVPIVTVVGWSNSGKTTFNTQVVDILSRAGVRVGVIKDMDETTLADFHPNFADERLPELLLHYKAKHFPTSLTEAETQKWQEYRQNRLNRQAPIFLAELQKFQAEGADEFILEELRLWFQSLQDSGY